MRGRFKKSRVEAAGPGRVISVELHMAWLRQTKMFRWFRLPRPGSTLCDCDREEMVHRIWLEKSLRRFRKVHRICSNAKWTESIAVPLAELSSFCIKSNSFHTVNRGRLKTEEKAAAAAAAASFNFLDCSLASARPKDQQLPTVEIARKDAKRPVLVRLHLSAEGIPQAKLF